MKQLLFTLLSFLVLSASTFANEINVSVEIRSSFETSFSQAENVKWSERGGFTVADFQLNNKNLCAYYEKNGDLVVVAQQIMESELPKGLQSEIAKKFSGGLVTTAFKMVDNDGTSFSATIVKDKKEYILKAVNGKWNVLQTKQL